MNDSSRTPRPAKRPTATRPPPGTGRRLYTPVLVGTLVALAVLLPGTYLWRAFQVKRGAVAYLERADNFAKEEKWGQSAESLFLYVHLKPDDVLARIRLA